MQGLGATAGHEGYKGWLQRLGLKAGCKGRVQRLDASMATKDISMVALTLDMPTAAAALDTSMAVLDASAAALALDVSIAVLAASMAAFDTGSLGWVQRQGAKAKARQGTKVGCKGRVQSQGEKGAHPHMPWLCPWQPWTYPRLL